jgi:hypothetical protein
MLVDVDRPALEGGGRAASMRDLKPDEIGRKIVDREIGRGRAED